MTQKALDSQAMQHRLAAPNHQLPPGSSLIPGKLWINTETTQDIGCIIYNVTSIIVKGRAPPIFFWGGLLCNSKWKIPTLPQGFCKVLTNPMQSQLKTIQPQLKTLRKKGKNTARARKVVFLLQVLIHFFNCKCKDLQGGTPLWTCYLQFVKRILIKKTVFLNKVKFWIW